MEVFGADILRKRALPAAAGFGADQAEVKGHVFRPDPAVDLPDQHVHGPVDQGLVVPVDGGQPRAGQLRAGEVVEPGDDGVRGDGAAALVEPLDQAQGHVVVGADEGVGEGVSVPRPALAQVIAVGGAPGAAEHLDVGIGDAVLPTGVQEAVQAPSALGGAVVQQAREIDHAARAVFADEVLGDAVLGPPVVDAHQRAALHGAIQRHRGDAAGHDAPGQGVAGGFQHDLVALHQHAVEPAQVGQVEYGVLAPVLRVAQVLAEAVEYAQIHVLMVRRELLQALQRGLHQFIIPVRREEGDSVFLHGHALPLFRYRNIPFLYNNINRRKYQGESAKMRMRGTKNSPGARRLRGVVGRQPFFTRRW